MKKDYAMKKRLSFALCLVLFTVSFGFSQEAGNVGSGLSPELQTYIDYYERARTWTERQGVLQNAVAEAPAGAEQLYAELLRSVLNTYSSIRGAQDLAVADSIVKTSVEKLGDAKYSAAAPDVNRALAAVKDSVVRSASMTALGKMQAKEYLPQIIRILQDVNNQPAAQNRQPSEQLAYGAIVALDYFRDESGYIPVFFAAHSWYDEWVKTQARQTLAKISGEPWDLLISVLKSSSYTVENKREALQAIDESSAENSKKSEAANTALAQTWLATPRNSLDRENIKDMRKTSIRMLGKYGTEDSSAYGQMERTYNEGDLNEKRATIETLSTLANSQSVAILSRFLQTMNTRLDDSLLTNSDRALTQAIITALGKTGNNEAKTALSSVLNHDWTNSIKNLARTNLQKLQ
jgi:HEAT repeat protein